MEGVHDLGGMGGFGPVLTEDGEKTHHHRWELRAQIVTATALYGHNIRQFIESIDPITYLDSSYYVRWLRAGEAGSVAIGCLTEADLVRWRDTIEDGEAVPVALNPDLADSLRQVFTTRAAPMKESANARFDVGNAVVVRRMRDGVHHHRCPRYVRGASGVIENVCGDGSPPDGPRRGGEEPEYTVSFRSTDLWGPTDEPPFTVHVDLYEHHLDPA